MEVRKKVSASSTRVSKTTKATISLTKVIQVIGMDVKILKVVDIVKINRYVVVVEEDVALISNIKTTNITTNKTEAVKSKIITLKNKKVDPAGKVINILAGQTKLRIMLTELLKVENTKITEIALTMMSMKISRQTITNAL